MPADYTAIDLFSGCGGLSSGLEQAGFRVVGAIERDPLAASTYRANHPGVPVWEADIRTVTVASVRRELGLRPRDLTVVAGCPPCQAFSRMRTLNRTKQVSDDRSDLVFQYLRFVRGLRPAALMFENVPDLIHDPRYAALLEGLGRLGYRCHGEVRDAADFGVPQRRRRLVLMAGRGFSVTFPEAAEKDRKTVRDAIGGLKPPATSLDPAHNVIENRQPRIMDLIRRVPKDGGSRKDLRPEDVLACHRRCDGFSDVYGRMRWDDVAPTLTGSFVNPSKGRFLHPEQDRCVTPREAALLQTFSPDYRFLMQGGKYPTAQLIGNAFPPEFGRRHAAALRTAIESEPRVMRRATS